jgi:putative transposase
MPIRPTPLINTETYHIFNRTIADQPIFSDDRICNRALKTFWFYQKRQQRKKLSDFLRMGGVAQEEFLSYMNTLPSIVALHCYCLMPNHFHLLVTQRTSGGISYFVGALQNSLAHFYNTLRGAKSPIFLPGFQAVHIDSDAQLMHVSRYIHLNPYTSSLVHSFTELYDFPWSSLKDYLSPSLDISMLDTSLINSLIGAPNKHRQFIDDQADYQRSLHFLTHSRSV